MKGAGADAPLLRSTRLRLMAWSGGLTLVVLLALGASIFVAVSRSLESEALAQLERRAAELAPLVELGLPQEPVEFSVDIAPGEVQPGFVFLGPASGTFAMIVGPDDAPIGLAPQARTIGLPYRPGLDAARRDGIHVGVAELAGTSARVLSRTVVSPDGTQYVVQVVSVRTLEERTLRSLLNVLALGGLLVLAATLVLGYLYAGRALVPIRESLRRQREFAADVSHELRTPLAVVRATLSDLERRAEERIGDASADLKEMEAQTDQLTELVDELLLFARSESGAAELEMAPLDLSEAVVAATRRLQRLADQRQVQLEAQLAPVPLHGDARRLEQLVAILVDNAIRHSPPGGVVQVSATPATPGALAELVVDDKGPGIPADQLKLIFDRFHQLPSSRPGGAGLGLAIARWIAERHGGSIRAENLPNGGARLVVSLPA